MSYLRLWKGLVLVAVTSAPLMIGVMAKASTHEITEFEARKLTFSALTATPVVHHYRRYHARRRSYSLAANHRVHKTKIRTVTYRGRVVTRHVRNRHHRRG